MNKKVFIIGSAVIVIAMLAVGAVFAAAPIKLVINKLEVEAEVPPQRIDGRVMVPIRAVAEALGAEVKWDQQANTVHISSSNSQSLQKRVEQLEKALVPGSSKRAAELWMEGVKTRNAALQYAVLSPLLRTQELESFEMIQWKIPGSSPWMAGYVINEGNKISDDILEYKVQCKYTDSTGMDENREVMIVVQNIGQHWYVVEYK